MLGVLVMVATLIGSVASAEPVHRVQSNRCLSCHGMPNLVVRDSTGRTLHDFSVPPAFASSVHGRLACELNRTGFFGGLFLREDGAHVESNEVLPRAA